MPAVSGEPDLGAAWSVLEPPFREALDLAWQSCAGGTVGVGSVITAAEGRQIARGRNRVFDAPGGEGVLQGTLLAHAEMNALAEIPAGMVLESCVLWSTQQPCPLCASAAVMAGVGAVRFLAADPFYGRIVQRLPTIDEWVADAWPRYDGPTADDGWAIVAMLFQLNAAASRNPRGEVMRANRRDEPEMVRLIEHIVAERVWTDATEIGRSVLGALSDVWPWVLQAAAERRERRLRSGAGRS
jgi:tRNA(Arg) A34 adenosine deaminase TadA